MVLFLVANCSRIPKMCMFWMFGGQIWLLWFVAVKSDLQTGKTCTFLESSSNLLPEKVPFCFETNLKFWLFHKFSIFTAGRCASGRSQNIKKVVEQKFCCHDHTQLSRLQGLWISRKTQITPPYCMKNSI
jgi:hypothetical protein